MEIQPVSDALGVRLIDFDITRPATAEERQELRDLLAQHHLLLVRGQEVTGDDQTRFVSNFGPLHLRDDGMKETFIANMGADGQPTSRTGTAPLAWHQDGTYGPRPGIATCLWGTEIAPDSVPTLFANAVRALDGLDPGFRSHLETLHVQHMRDLWDEQTDTRWREVDVDLDSPASRYVRCEHPIVYPMPHQDRHTLLVHKLMTSHIMELPPDEGEDLIQQLFSLIYAEDNIYRHEWQTNDVVIWDNLALHHARPGEMGLPVRRLRRQTIDGWYTPTGVIDWVESVIVPDYARAPAS